MITRNELNDLGIPNIPEVMPLAMRLVNVAIGRGADEKNLREKLETLVDNPSSLRNDPILGEIAKALIPCLQESGYLAPRLSPVPWEHFGLQDIDPAAIEQIKQACLLPNAVRGALLPDAHLGYGLPIGGVLAVEGAVIPYAVGVDIACRMRLTVLDMPVSALSERRAELVTAVKKETRFGLGASFEKNMRREHAVIDEDWTCYEAFLPGLRKDKAWSQLGTSGGGNHFVEFGELHLAKKACLGGVALDPGVYLALLSHSGSRGSGEAVAKHYSSLAISRLSYLPKAMRHLAWLPIDSSPGQEYWMCMELMGRYAAANHELIHRHILDHLGALALTYVENHHNFAWLEEHDGKKVIVHRKGATPAGYGVQGIIPGSMASSGFVVQGLGNEKSLASCSHGAGRRMSRAEAFRSLSHESMQDYLRKHQVELLGGALDESPEAYKDIDEVMALQSELVEILARFIPRIVRMAPERQEGRFGKKKETQE